MDKIIKELKLEELQTALEKATEEKVNMKKFAESLGYSYRSLWYAMKEARIKITHNRTLNKFLAVKY